MIFEVLNSLNSGAARERLTHTRTEHSTEDRTIEILKLDSVLNFSLPTIRQLSSRSEKLAVVRVVSTSSPFCETHSALNFSLPRVLAPRFACRIVGKRGEANYFMQSAPNDSKRLSTGRKRVLGTVESLPSEIFSLLGAHELRLSATTKLIISALVLFLHLRPRDRLNGGIHPRHYQMAPTSLSTK